MTAPGTSPSGHIPLNKTTLDCMGFDERYFWNNFLHDVMEAINKERTRGTPLPYKFSPELRAKFQTAIYTYDGLRYCQIQQIRDLFDTTAAQTKQ